MNCPQRRLSVDTRVAEKCTFSTKASSISWTSDSQTMNSRTFNDGLGKIIAGWLRGMLASCCGGGYESDSDGPPKPLKIGKPTDFRREDVTLQGLSEIQQTYIREKARTDANKMFETLKPLRSSPSGHFAERPASNNNSPPPEEEEESTPSAPTTTTTTPTLFTPQKPLNFSRSNPHLATTTPSPFPPPPNTDILMLDPTPQPTPINAQVTPSQRPASGLGRMGFIPRSEAESSSIQQTPSPSHAWRKEHGVGGDAGENGDWAGFVCFDREDEGAGSAKGEEEKEGDFWMSR